VLGLEGLDGELALALSLLPHMGLGKSLVLNHPGSKSYVLSNMGVFTPFSAYASAFSDPDIHAIATLHQPGTCAPLCSCPHKLTSGQPVLAPCSAQARRGNTKMSMNSRWKEGDLM
jgi:hypothetical protein